jgi:nickel-type superoxide dismutase maturation protease
MQTAGDASIAGRLLAPIMRLSPIARYVVDGPSMEPAYRAGDRVVVNKLAYRRAAPREGEVVVLRDPLRRRRFLIKRIARVLDDGAAPRYMVLGDNAAESRDSRLFGPVGRELIVGRAWFRY